MKSRSREPCAIATLLLSLLVIPVLVPPVSASPGIDVYKGTFQKITTTGDQTIDGVGFTPKAVIFWWTRQTAFGELAAIHVGYGFATNYSATYQNRGVAFASDDAAAKSNAGRIRSETYCINILSAGTPTLVAKASVTAFISDGFTLNWAANEARADYIHFVALGGADITNARAGTFTLATGTGSQAVTDVGFQPNFLMFLWTFTEAVDTATAHGEIGMGLAKNSTKRGALVAFARDNLGTMATYQQQRTDSCILLLRTAGAQDAIVDFVSMDSDGFTVTKSDDPAVATPIFYLALKGGRYAVGNFLSPTSTGTQDITTVGFQPKLVMFATQGRATATAIGSTSEITFGGATSSTARGCTWFEDPDAMADSDNEMETLNTKVIQWRDRTAANTFTLRGSADFVQFLTNGFRLSWSNVETAGREIIYAAFGDGPVTYFRTGDVSFSFSGLPSGYLDAVRTVATSLVFTSVASELSVFARTVTQATVALFGPTGLSYVCRSVSEAVAAGFILLGTGGFFRSTTFSIVTALQTSGIVDLFRSMSLYMSTLFQSDAYLTIVRSISQDISAAFDVSTYEMSVRTVLEPIVAAFSSERLQTLARSLSQQVLASVEAIRLVIINRNIVQSVTTTLEAIRAQTLQRGLTLSAAFQAALSRGVDFARALAQAFQGSFVVSFSEHAGRVVAQSFTTVFEAIKYAGVTRDAQLAASIQFLSYRVVNYARTGPLNFSAQLFAACAQAISHVEREVGLTVAGTFIAVYERINTGISRLTSRQVTLAIVMTFAAIREKLVLRDAAMPMTVLFETLRKSYLQRQSMQVMISEFANTWTKTALPPSVSGPLMLALGLALVVVLVALRRWVFARARS
jgi:hypothetical protein